MAEASRLRIEKVLSLRTDSAAMIESLDAISSFYHENTVEARRCLRQDLEFQNIQLAKKFLAEFDTIRARVETVEELSGTLQGACDAVAKRVSEADENMKLFMEKASELQDRSNQYSAQSKDITLFLAKFQLSPLEMETLEEASLDDNQGTQDFFQALNRLEKAYEECKSMLEKHHYSAGFELLDALGQHQDRSYHRLFEWVKKECTASLELTADDVDTKLQTSIKCLQRLPTYFAQCEDLVVHSRRSQLVSKFITALTQGGSGSGSGGGGAGGGGGGAGDGDGGGSTHTHAHTHTGRAIDMHSHDAPRYLSDMLAWMHQTVASEQEFLEAVFGRLTSLPPPRAGAGGAGGGGDGGDEAAGAGGDADAGVGDEAAGAGEGEGEEEGQERGNKQPETLLARCVQGLGRPLRVRVLQSIESSSSSSSSSGTGAGAGAGGIATLYRCVDLLAFYEAIFAGLIRGENAIHSAVRGCLQEGRRALSQALQRHGTQQQAQAQPSPIDLTASHSTRGVARTAREVVRASKCSLSGLCLDPADALHVNVVVGALVPPLLASVQAGAKEAGLAREDLAVLMLNSLGVLAAELASVGGFDHVKPPTNAAATSGAGAGAGAGDGSEWEVPPAAAAHLRTDWTLDLAQQTQSWLEVLVIAESEKALSRSGLNRLAAALEAVPPGVQAASQGAIDGVSLSAESVGATVRAFYASLFSTSAPQFDKLRENVLREAARTATAGRIAHTHAYVYRQLTAPEHGFGDAMAGVLTHSPAEVGVLLGIK